MSDKTWDALGTAFGWISFVLWSLSFYPQMVQNYMSKSVAGFSVEFAMLNPAGFYCYTIYNLQGLVNPKIGSTGDIETNDVVFALHAFALSSIQLTQVFMYDTGDQKSINYIVVGFLIFLFLNIFVFAFIEVFSPKTIGLENQDYGTIRMCGYSKAAITFFKYMPQVYLNWKRKSTVGWSLENVLLDFGGGFFSFAQTFVQTIAQGQPLFGDGDHGFNIVKFLLSVFAMGFDLIFMFQHFVLYRDKWQDIKNRKKRYEEIEQHNDEVEKDLK